MNSPETKLRRLARTEVPIGVGIIGLGASGSWAERAHVPALRAVDGYELRALSTSSPESASRSGRVHGVERTFGSAAELAACDVVDLVVVAVKVPHHRELVTAAIEAGKAVLCEWPLGNGLTEAEILAELARSRNLPTVVGLQARSNPAIGYLRDLVAAGYVGDVLSTTIVGSGGSWGAEAASRNRYLLDPVNGATMLTIPFSHMLDGVAAVIGEPDELRIEQHLRRSTVALGDRGELVPMRSADQLVGSGRFPGGVVASFHYRGGLCRGTNFRWEINGTDGDLVVTAPTGHLQLAAISISGASHGDRELSVLDVPARYVKVPTLDPVADAPAYGAAHTYRQFLDDLRSGNVVAPDFAHGVRRHRTIERAIVSP